MNLSRRQFRYFLATAEAGQVSQAAVPQRVAINRHPRPAAVGGDAGRRIISSPFRGHGADGRKHAISEPCAGCDVGGRRRSTGAAEPQGRSDRRSPRGPDYTVAGYFLPRHLLRFTRSFPDVRFQLFELSRAAIEIGLKDRTLDIAVVSRCRGSDCHHTRETKRTSPPRRPKDDERKRLRLPRRFERSISRLPGEDLL